MSKCVNLKSKEFQSLVEISGINSMELSAKMGIWMDENDTDIWPTLEQLGISDKSIKEGVDFVFEQNPELSKIGSRQQYSQYLNTVFPDYINNFAYEAVEEFLVANKIIDRKC